MKTTQITDTMPFTPLLILNKDKDFIIDTEFYHGETLNNQPIINGKCAGVYIMGFLHPNKPKWFIPYYVGMAGKDTVIERVRSHVSKIYSPKSTYRRLTTNYFLGLNGMVPFYKDPNFPLYTCETRRPNLKQENEWLKKIDSNFEKYIFYLHNREFFLLADPFLSSQKKQDIKTQLKDLPTQWSIKNGCKEFFGQNKHNLRFIYWDINESAFKPQFEDKETFATTEDMIKYMEIFEAIAKFSLAGKTSGSSITLEILKERMASCNMKITFINSIDANLNYIFRKNPSLNYHSEDELKSAYNKENPYTTTVQSLE